MDLRGDWSYPTTVRFGPGRIAELPEAVRAAGIARPLFVTDPALAAQPRVAAALEGLHAAGITPRLFSAIKPNPVDANIRAGIAAFRAGGHDGVVAFGGGSALDAGKLIAFMQGQTRPVWDFEDVSDHWKRADTSRLAAVVAVPTTAGTGSEVGRAAVLGGDETPTKKVIFHPAMLPRIALCDPELTLGMPPQLTAGTGMDAFSHCLEAYCGRAYHPLADGIALEGMRLVKDNLERAHAHGGDRVARAQMMAAALMGATAFQKALGAIHALSHPIGALHDTHHGMTNAVLVPYVLMFNRAAIEEKIVRLAAWLGLNPSFNAFLDWVVRLRITLGVPHTLTQFGVTDSHVDKIADLAPKDPAASGNPIALDAAGARGILAAAHAGRL